MSEGSPFITFLSDYGLNDEFVGICHGVIARRCPQARVIDLTHGIPSCAVSIGAIVLRDAVAFTPPGVHLAVVDPSVGATGAQARRAVALRTEQDRLLVGPDNGLLMPAADRLGGVVEAVDIGASSERLKPVSATFHGRDVFAPVAAALAAGTPLRRVGQPLEARLLRRIELPVATVSGEELHAHVLSVDHFGNVALDAEPVQLEQIGLKAGVRASIEAGAGRPTAMFYGRAFADVQRDELLLYCDSRNMVALAVNEGSAVDVLGLAAGDALTLRRA